MPRSAAALSEKQARALLRERVAARRGELEPELMARVLAVPDPRRAVDPAYHEMLRAAVAAALQYGIEAIDADGLREPPIPVALLAQARLAARNDVGLDTVLRRYFAGYAVLACFLAEEAGREGLMGAAGLRGVLDAQSRQLERLLAGVAEEYAREARSLLSSGAHRRARLVRAVLDEEPVDRGELAYDFDGWHLGVVASGTGAPARLAGAGEGRGQRVLLVPTAEDTAWAWLGSRRRQEAAEVARSLGPLAAEGLTIALGEPAQGLAGWRLTHRQAILALPVAMRLGRSLVRYAEVGLLASVLGDETLAASLRGLYLEPWSRERDAETLHETLRAYFAAEQNVSSAAAALGVKRHTVTNRLRRVEERLGHPLGECSVELATALRLHEVAGMAEGG